MNAAGARNVYSTKTLLGNWEEDTRGVALATSMVGKEMHTGTSETRAAFTQPVYDSTTTRTPFVTESEALSSCSTLGGTAATRADNNRFLTVSHGMQQGASSNQILTAHGLDEAPSAYARCEKIIARNAMVRATGCCCSYMVSSCFS